MNDVTSIRELFQYMHWADAAVWRAISAIPKVAGDTLLRDRLFHLHTVQHGFLAVWQRIPIDFIAWAWRGKPEAKWPVWK